MAYGTEMKRLNPCGDEVILPLLLEYCPAPAAILDAGCGRGDRLAALHRALPAAKLRGIDRDAENAALAKAACPAAEITVGELCALPRPEPVFDAALCECTLSLTDAPAAGLAALAGCLRPGGVLLLGDLCAEGNPVTVACGTVRRVFSRSALEQSFLRAGFVIREYRDQREALLTMAAQMIMDGSFCSCVDPAAAAALKQHQAGYGLWVLEKEGNR